MIFSKIESLCRQRGISVGGLERELCFGNATIRGWAKSDPSASKLKQVADYFGVTVDELLTEVDTNKEE